MESVSDLVGEWRGPLDLLINNARIMTVPDLELTIDGWELHFATNHLGHFALALGLQHALVAAWHARIVSVSSRGHMRSPVVFDDINFIARLYDWWLAYGQSKTANVLVAVDATRRWAADGIFANAVHPGGVIDTNLSRYMEPERLAGQRATLRFKTPEQGAATSVLVATAPQLEGIGVRYFEDCNEAVVTDPSTSKVGGSGVAAYALDPVRARRLWDISIAAVVEEVPTYEI